MRDLNETPIVPKPVVKLPPMSVPLQASPPIRR